MEVIRNVSFNMDSVLLTSSPAGKRIQFYLLDSTDKIKVDMIGDCEQLLQCNNLTVSAEWHEASQGHFGNIVLMCLSFCYSEF